MSEKTSRAPSKSAVCPPESYSLKSYSQQGLQRPSSPILSPPNGRVALLCHRNAESIVNFRKDWLTKQGHELNNAMQRHRGLSVNHYRHQLWEGCTVKNDIYFWWFLNPIQHTAFPQDYLKLHVQYCMFKMSCAIMREHSVPSATCSKVECLLNHFSFWSAARQASRSKTSDC